MQVLIVKLTSMGDLIHALPALTDAQRNIPDITFHWVIDESFYEVATWHPTVKTVIKSAHRRWKRSWSTFLFKGEARAFYRQLNSLPVDVVLDAQSNLKSAVITRLCHYPRHGLNKHSIREPFAHLAYSFHYSVDKSQHAIARQRELFAKALGYDIPVSAPDYQIQLPEGARPNSIPDSPFLFFVHNASWTTKLWPNEHWLSIIELALSNGYKVVLPSGNAQELERAQHLASKHPNVIALPRLSLTETAYWIKSAAGAICTDTGLCHLAAALSTPSVSLYGPTDTALIGATGQNQVHLVSETFACRPCYKKQCQYYKPEQDEAACMKAISPHTVWDTFQSLLKKGKR